MHNPHIVFCLLYNRPKKHRRIIAPIMYIRPLWIWSAPKNNDEIMIGMMAGVLSGSAMVKLLCAAPLVSSSCATTVIGYKVCSIPQLLKSNNDVSGAIYRNLLYHIETSWTQHVSPWINKFLWVRPPGEASTILALTQQFRTRNALRYKKIQ